MALLLPRLALFSPRMALPSAGLLYTQPNIVPSIHALTIRFTSCSTDTYGTTVVAGVVHLAADGSLLAAGGSLLAADGIAISGSIGICTLLISDICLFLPVSRRKVFITITIWSITLPCRSRLKVRSSGWLRHGGSGRYAVVQALNSCRCVGLCSMLC